MTRKRRSWIWLVVATAVVLALLLLAFAGMSVYLVTRDMQVTRATAASAERELADARARLADDRPLIRMEGREPRLLESRADLEARAAKYTGPPPERLRVMVFDPGEDKLVRLSVPMWFVRLRGSSALPVQLGGGTRAVTLDLEHLDRIGPALLIDQEFEGARLLVWTE
jgi:hypothetical protein